MAAVKRCGKLGEVDKDRSRPILVPLHRFRPTQVAVGMRSVKHKRLRLENRSAKSIRRLLSHRPIPTVQGPDGQLYIVDHHHFGLALWHADVDRAYAQIIDDKSELSATAFWRLMEAEGRVYPYDEEGQRVGTTALPLRLYELRHDSFRDLAWDVREAGGFRKTKIPYAEFQWANYFRQRIDRSTIRIQYDVALKTALRLCRSKTAAALPGFICKTS